MRPNPSQPGAGSDLTAAWDKTLIGSDLANLVPINRREQNTLPLKLALLVLSLAAFLGLPLAGIVLCWSLALLVEALSFGRQSLLSWPKALGRRVFWVRVRAPVYWTLATGVGLVALFAGETLGSSLFRGIFLWLVLRAIEDVVKHPERYGSRQSFLDWQKRVLAGMARAWSVWLRYVILAGTIGLVLTLISPGLWEALGNTSWTRLLIFGSGVYLLSMAALITVSQQELFSCLREALQNGGKAKANDLARTLWSIQRRHNDQHDSPRYAKLLERRLLWKNTDHLVSRVRSELEKTLALRIRWNMLWTSLSVILLVFGFVVASVFLILPRHIMARWVAPDGTAPKTIVLVFDDVEELINGEFLDRFSNARLTGLAQDPLPKVAFLEATIIVSLLLVQTAVNRKALRAMTGLSAKSLQRRIRLGTAYLVFLESEFQYLYSGFVTRQMAGAKKYRLVTMRNEIMLAPSVASKVDVYRAISDYLHTYSSQERTYSPKMLSLFDSYSFAQAWTARFVHLSASDEEVNGTHASEGVGARSSEVQKYWMWSGQQLVALTSLEEAERYGRFVAR